MQKLPIIRAQGSALRTLDAADVCTGRVAAAGRHRGPLQATPGGCGCHPSSQRLDLQLPPLGVTGRLDAREGIQASPGLHCRPQEPSGWSRLAARPSFSSSGSFGDLGGLPGAGCPFCKEVTFAWQPGRQIPPLPPLVMGLLPSEDLGRRMAGSEEPAGYPVV